MNYSNKDITKELIYFNEELMNISKAYLEKGNGYYKKAMDSVINIANEKLSFVVDPVVNKTIVPPSGDMHDFCTLSPYYWPNPDTPDGLPWIYKDGLINPIFFTDKQDYKRLTDMFDAVDALNIAYYFTGDVSYMNKAKEIIKIWFVDDETKMNPNVNHAGVIPGFSDGTCFGIIRLGGISYVVTTLQLMQRDHLVEASYIDAMNKWIEDYLNWLLTSELGKLESTRINNHSSNYDYQAVGLILYLGRYDEAVALLEKVKKMRIEVQIAPDGSQPLELSRTKSVSYCRTNLWPLVQLAEMAARFTEVDLWNYESEEGVSLRKAFDFLLNYLNNQDEWYWEQIHDSVEVEMAKAISPLLLKTARIFGYQHTDMSKESSFVSAAEILKYNITGNDKPVISADVCLGTVPENSGIKVNWFISDPLVKEYTLYRKSSLDGEYAKIKDLTEDYYMDFDVKKGDAYIYKIEAKKSDDMIELSHSFSSKYILESKCVTFNHKWMDLYDKLCQSAEGTEERITLRLCEKIPGFIFNAIKGKNITLIIDQLNGILWTVKGEDIEEDTLETVDFSIYKNKSVIPDKDMNQLPDGLKKIKIRLGNLLSYTFDAKTVLYLGEQYAGHDVKVYYYVHETELMEEQYTTTIDEKGEAPFTFRLTPDYAIVILDK